MRQSYTLRTIPIYYILSVLIFDKESFGCKSQCKLSVLWTCTKLEVFNRLFLNTPIFLRDVLLQNVLLKWTLILYDMWSMFTFINTFLWPEWWKNSWIHFKTALKYYIYLRDTNRLSKSTYCQGLEGKGPKGTKHLLSSRPYQWMLGRLYVIKHMV